MSTLLADIERRALDLTVPLSVHLDITWRCNETCIHCYCDHSSPELGAMELRRILDELAAAGTLFLSISGGEPFTRSDVFELLAYARKLNFYLTVKSNGTLINDEAAERLAALNLARLQVSIYSMRPEVHDGITQMPGSLGRSVRAVRLLRSYGVPVHIVCIVMRDNAQDHQGVRDFAEETGAIFKLDPRVTPRLDGDSSVLGLNIEAEQLVRILSDPTFAGGRDPDCPAAQRPGPEVLDSLPCSAGHTSCYINPRGDVCPCVQFPLIAGNVTKQPFSEIWNGPVFAGVRSIRNRDLPVCSSCEYMSACKRCPGLAYMQGDVRGPSLQDCATLAALTGTDVGQAIPNV